MEEALAEQEELEVGEALAHVQEQKNSEPEEKTEDPAPPEKKEEEEPKKLTLRESMEQAAKEAAEKKKTDSEPKEKKETKPEEVSEETPATDSDSKQKSQSKQEKITAPHSWDAEAKKEFDSYPEHAKKLVAQRMQQMESGLNRKLSEVATLKRQYQSLDNLFAGREQQYALQGVTKDQVVGQLLAAQDLLDNDPVAGIKWIAKSYGYTLEDLANQAEQRKVDPQVAEMQRELSDVKGLLNQQTAQQQQSTLSAYRDLAQQFAAQVDEGGQALYPHLGNQQFVYQDFLPMLRNLKQANPQAHPVTLMQEAYKKAIRLNDSLYGEMVEKQVEQRISTQEQKRRAQAEKAKNASSSISGAPGGKGGVAIKSARDAINAALKHHAAV